MNTPCVDPHGAKRAEASGRAARTPVLTASLRLRLVLEGGRLELEAPTLTLTESQFALAALAALREGERDAVAVLRSFCRKVRPTLMPPVV